MSTKASFFNPVCIFLLAALIIGCEQQAHVALGTLEWDQVHGRAVASQPIVELLVKEGDTVKRGQPLLRLDSSLQVAEVARLSANALESEWRYKQMQAGYRSEEIASSIAAAEAAKINRETRQTEYDREKSLFASNASSARALDDLSNALAQAKAEERSKDQRRQMMESGYRAEEIAQAKAALDAAQAALTRAEERLKLYTVEAERDGVLDSLPFKLGDKPPQGAVVSTVLAGQFPWARVYVPQPWLSRMKPGDVVDILVDGRTEPLPGAIRHISANASYTPYYTLSEEDRSRLSFVTEVDLIEDSSTTLPLGIPVRMKLRDPGQQ